MYIDWTVLTNGVAFIKVEYDPTTVSNCLYDGVTIEDEKLSLEYTGKIEGGLLFELTDKATGDKNPIGFSLRYWAGYQIHNVEDNQPSGVYIFRPNEG